MRAIAITKYGEMPRLIDRPVPKPQTAELLVRVSAAPINPLDLLCASGASYFGRHPLPYVPGVEGVGVVVEGEAFAAGTRVWFTTDAGMRPVDGSMSDYCLVRADAATPMWAPIDDALAAGLGLSAVAARLAIGKAGRLQPGQQVLVLGAGGTVGRLAIQMARLMGARRVVAAARTPAAIPVALGLGADAAIVLAGDRMAMQETLRSAVVGDLTLVVDALWGEPAAAALALLAPGGRLVNFGSSAGATTSLASSLLRSGEVSIIGYTNARASFAEKAAALTEAWDWAARGVLRLDHERVSLDDAAAAWARQRVGTDRKLVLVP